ncbi:hypothetical protein GCM10007111_27370 [Virgibacillus kapii]|uniref:Zn(2)-C6 fungal-type domain-containing protein n=1 Tax=Virgibacillus kapii TaxID=1638645 RepID=A0ABQ2DN14_9BACI|nr:hypothetical protein GCM10007111_27370 [Virgibacillus kapii]
MYMNDRYPKYKNKNCDCAANTYNCMYCKHAHRKKRHNYCNKCNQQKNNCSCGKQDSGKIINEIYNNVN